MKRIIILTVLFLLAGLYTIAAQDLIVLRNGTMLEARVLEISQTEIRYKRFDHLDGPTIVIPIADVLSIRYENGRQESFANRTPASIPSTSASAQRHTQPVRTYDTAIDPNKFIFGISAFGGGSVGTGNMGGGGGLRFEFGGGNFNSEINIGSGFPDVINFLATFNYFWHSKIGGFYLGGGLGYYWSYGWFYGYGYEDWNSSSGYHWVNDWGYAVRSHHFFQFGLNTGYKFVTRSGVFFNLGAFIGGAVGSDVLFIFRPDFSFGWTMR